MNVVGMNPKNDTINTLKGVVGPSRTNCLGGG